MRTLLSSPRRRRRATWLLIALAVVAALAGATRMFPKGKSFESTLSDEPAQVVAPERPVLAKRTEVKGALDAGVAFVRTAVVRRHLARSYDLAAPELKEGMTRDEWRKGDIPVVPFPAARIVNFRLAWTERNDIGLDLVLMPRPHTGMRVKTFLIEMKRYGSGSHGRWLVADWQPRGLSQTTLNPGLFAKSAPSPTTSLSARWLLLPLAVFGFFLLLLAALGVRGWCRGVQAMRDYRSTLL